MKKLIFFLTILVGILFGCNNDNGTDPKPTILNFNLDMATYNGNEIQPRPNYQLTMNFTTDGMPDAYSTVGNATITPSISDAGTWSISGNKLTFTNGNENREVTVSAGSVDNESTNFSLTWEMDKTEVALNQVGEYTYSFKLVE